MQIKVGADPEAFVKKDGEVIPVCGLLGGTKQEPLQMAGLEEGFAVQEDGAAAEFNIPAARHPEEFAENIELGVKWLRKSLKNQGVELASDIRAISLKKEWLDKWPQLAVLGCDPDYNAYGQFNGKAYTPVALNRNMAQIGTTRGVGGHIHIGYDKAIVPPGVLVQLLDLFIGTPLFPHDPQGLRRTFWGTPGLFREKPYGVEYRTLSNFWIFKPVLAQALAGMCVDLVSSINKNPVEWQALFANVGQKYYYYVIDSQVGGPLSGNSYREALKKALIKTPIAKDLVEKYNWDELVK